MLLYIHFFGISCYCDKQPEQKLLSRRKELFRLSVLSIVLDSLPSTPPHHSPPLYHGQGKQHMQLGNRRQSKAAHLIADGKWGREESKKNACMHTWSLSFSFLFHTDSPANSLLDIPRSALDSFPCTSPWRCKEHKLYFSTKLNLQTQN